MTSIVTAMDLQDGSQFARLPSAVLTRITHSVTTWEYSELRLTCKMVERKTFGEWAKAFFNARQVMVSTMSLDLLAEISQHPEIRQALKTLVISADFIPESFQTPAPPEQEQARLDAFQDQDWLFGTGLWIPKLASALALLPNLKAIHIQNYYLLSRSPHDLLPHWDAYGMRIYRVPGLQPNRRAAFDRVYQGTLLAIAQSGCTPASFQVSYVDGSVSDAALRIPDILLPKLKPLLNKLETLSITGGSRHSSLMPNLQKLVSLTPNVSKLEVQLGVDRNRIYKDISPTSDQFWASFSLPPTPGHILPRLERLIISTSVLQLDEILSIVSEYQLRFLSLWTVTLIDPSAVDGVEPTNLWASFLRALSGTSLEEIVIAHAYQYGYSASAKGDEAVYRRRIRFGYGETTYMRVSAVGQSGEDMFAQTADEARMLMTWRPLPSGGEEEREGESEVDSEESNAGDGDSESDEAVPG